MTVQEKAQLCRDLHAHFCARTGFDLVANDQRLRMWWDWCQFSNWTWTKDDLSRVIGYLTAQIKQDKRNQGALRFNTFVGSPDKFEEDEEHEKNNLR